MQVGHGRLDVSSSKACKHNYVCILKLRESIPLQQGRASHYNDNVMGVSTKNFMDEMTNLYTGLRACKYFFGLTVVLLQVGYTCTYIAK